MAGHSKWAGIKHKKAIVDAHRGKLFSKLARELIAAAGIGGGRPESNPRLRLAMTKARDANISKDSIEKAIKKGTGELEGVSYEEMILEGYGPGGVAIYVEALSDNKNRTSSELRNIFITHSGHLAGASSVAWLFEKKGHVMLKAQGLSEERLVEVVLEAGAEDLRMEGDHATVTTTPHALEPVRQALAKAGIAVESAEVTMVPSSVVRVEDPAQAKALLGLLDALEEHDDTQHVYANFDMPDQILSQYAGA
jgi:YebC/PmpR family DNA-binding regulatory protein